MRVLRVIFAAALFALGQLQPRGATHLVMMNNFNFIPSSITVDVGDTIIWTNTVITGHDTVCQGVWASALLPRRGTFSFTFNVAPGVYNYVCTPHVANGMIARVTVRGSVNNPPTATITSPANGQAFQVGETINVNVNASDDNSVSKVDLYVDGNLTQTDSAPPYQFSVSNLQPGAHTLLVRATDNAGLTGDSGVTVNVQFANPAPAVTITSPTNNVALNEPAVVVIAADVVGSVERLEFLTNNVVFATDTTAPYAVTNTFARGAYTITARAVGTDGQVGTASVAIEVGENIPNAPTVVILSPANGEYVTFASNIVLRAQAEDPDSTVSKVQFFSGTNSLGTVTTAGASNVFQLTTFLPEGIQTISAMATDATGLTGTSLQTMFIMQMAATNTYRTNIAPGVVRLGFFGSSGLPYVFEYSTDMTVWIPFRTNQFYRRIYFFDAVSPTNEPARFFRARSPFSVLQIFPNNQPDRNPPAPPVPTL